MKIIMTKTEAIKPYNKNPRHNDAAVDAVANSIKEFGFRQPIVVDKNNVIVAGHTRWKAAKKLGLKTVPVHVATGLTAKQVRAYRIADNKTNELATWDFNLLADELTALKASDFDLAAMGFSNAELLTIMPKPELTDPDAIPEPPKKAVTKKGDLWLLGEHRLLCGDSTKAEDVAKLMGGENAALCFTDPPYSVNYASRKEKVSATLASYQDPGDAEGLLYGFMSVMPTQCLLMTYTDKQLHAYVRTCDRLDYETIDLLVWKKQNFCFWPGARYQQQHELIFLARQKKAKFYSKTAGNASTVIEVPRQSKNNLHPTIRPVGLWVTLMENHTKERWIVYDPFCGSGTTLLAAEKLDRRCFGVEISNLYCDVIVKRWEDYTGKKAVLDKAKTH